MALKTLVLLSLVAVAQVAALEDASALIQSSVATRREAEAVDSETARAAVAVDAPRAHLVPQCPWAVRARRPRGLYRWRGSLGLSLSGSGCEDRSCAAGDEGSEGFQAPEPEPLLRGPSPSRLVVNHTSRLGWAFVLAHGLLDEIKVEL